jgi:hypothetical protein
MKKCSYCGKEYPDDAAVCAIDGESLPGSIMNRKKVTGVWRGVYGYGEREKRAGLMPVAFTLKLKQGWLDHFTGSVTEDAPQGMPGIGAIDGYFSSRKLEFNKQMPVGYITKPDGTRMTLREYILAEGYSCEHDLPSEPILYQGTFLDTNRVQGTWIINPRRIPLPGGLSFSTARTSGFWCAEFATSDARVNPSAGPTGSLFDKSLLSPRELEDVEGVAFRSLGKFNVADAEKFLERFGQEDIRFELKRDDAAMRQMMPITEVTGGYSGTAQMIEIFVHPDDEEKAAQIVGEDNKV